MRRAAYRALLALHPPAFRRDFGGEMLWIFDEAARDLGAGALLADGVASLARQWTLRSGAWKIALAMMAAAVQLALGAILMSSIRTGGRERFVSNDPELVAMMRLAALTAVVLLGAVMMLVFWWRRMARRAEG